MADVLPINGSEEDVELLREALLISRAATKAAKQSKKVKQGKGIAVSAVAASPTEAPAVGGVDEGNHLPQPDLKNVKRALEVDISEYCGLMLSD